MDTNHFILDIETGPLPKSETEPLCPPVKLGVTKDEAKVKKKKADHLEKYFEHNAIYAETGEVLIIGILDCNTKENISLEVNPHEPEHAILNMFWDWYKTNKLKVGFKVIGFNIEKFDMPFLWRRSLLNGIKPPKIFINYRYLDSVFVDLKKIWELGQFGGSATYQPSWGLDTLCKVFKTLGKNGSGKNFHELFEEDREQAREYLLQDLICTYNLGDKMGIVQNDSI